MTYARTLHGLGATGDRFAIGQEITAKFTPHGVNASNQVATFAALSTAMARLGVFRAPTYNGWGADANAGLVVFKAYTSTDAFTAKQIANKMTGVVADVTNTLGAARLTFVSITHPTPNGPAVTAAASAPDAASALVASDTSSYVPAMQPVTEEAGFFSRKVGGIPVWAIGGGVLALGAGLVTVAMVMRKKKAPAALAANRSRARLRRNGRADYRSRFSEDFGDEGDIGAHSAAASAVARAEGARARSLSQTGSALEAELRAEKLSKDAKFLDRLRRLRRNPPFTFTPEMYALHAQIEAEKAAKNAPRQAPKWTPMTLNRRGTR